MKKRDLALRLTGFVANKNAEACFKIVEKDIPIMRPVNNWLVRRGINSLQIGTLCLTAKGCSIPDYAKKKILENTLVAMKKSKDEFIVK